MERHPLDVAMEYEKKLKQLREENDRMRAILECDHSKDNDTRRIYPLEQEKAALITDNARLESELQNVRKALEGYPDSDLASLAKLYRDVYVYRTARCDDCETLDNHRTLIDKYREALVQVNRMVNEVLVEFSMTDREREVIAYIKLRLLAALGPDYM